MSQFAAQPACFHASSSTLPLQETEPTVFFSIWMSFFSGAVNIYPRLSQDANQKKQYMFFETKRKKKIQLKYVLNYAFFLSIKY